MAITLSEVVSLYSVNVVTGSDKNVLPSQVTLLAAGVACNIHRGASQAQDQADKTTKNGVYGGLAALAYFYPASYSLLADRRFVKDSNGDVWAIAGRPMLRNRFVRTAYVRCLLLYQVTPPAGLS